MLRRESGHKVNITSSLLAEQPLKALSAALTAITKGGLDAVTRSLAIEYADKGIRVNAVAPGAIRTLMHAMDTHAFLATMHPMGRIGEIHEIVDAVPYLEGATFVTSLMAEVLEDHIRHHLLSPERNVTPPHELAEDMIDLVRAYLK